MCPASPAHFPWPLFGACPGVCLPLHHQRGAPCSAICVGSCAGGASGAGVLFHKPLPRPATYRWSTLLWAAARGRLPAGRDLLSLAGENLFAAAPPPPPNCHSMARGPSRARRLGPELCLPIGCGAARWSSEARRRYSFLTQSPSGCPKLEACPVELPPATWLRGLPRLTLHPPLSHPSGSWLLKGCGPTPSWSFYSAANLPAVRPVRQALVRPVLCPRLCPGCFWIPQRRTAPGPAPCCLFGMAANSPAVRLVKQTLFKPLLCRSGSSCAAGGKRDCGYARAPRRPCLSLPSHPAAGEVTPFLRYPWTHSCEPTQSQRPHGLSF